VPSSLHSRRLFAICYTAVWTLIGLNNALTVHIGLANFGIGVPWWKVLTWELSSNYVNGALVLVIRELVLRVPLTAERWKRMLPFHLAAALAYCLVHVGTMVAIRKFVYLLHGLAYDMGALLPSLGYEMLKDIPGYFVYMIVIYGFDAQRKNRERTLEASRLETLLARAHAGRLEAQLQPHFLFNTLNAISALMYEDVRAADRMISRLGELLRLLADRSPDAEVSLSEEVAIVERYVEMMRLRFGERLHVRMEVAEEARGAMVPRFILQPLMENAIQHGIARCADGGRIELSGVRENGSLLLRLRNDGPPLEGRRRGVGLSNTAERLERLYGPGQSFAVENAAGGGVLVTMRLPYQCAAGEA
jgi:two-component system LytT family sensor kinase